MKKITYQSGFGLLEVLIATAIASLVIASSFNIATNRLQEIDAQTAAKQMKETSDAFIRYAKDNLATPGPMSATATTPFIITFATVQAAGYLPASSQNLNAFRQSYDLHLLQPTPGRFTGLVVTHGGDDINETRAPRIATLIGAEGGYIPQAAPTTARGSYGAWGVANINPFFTAADPNPGAGHLLATLSFNNNILLDDYLYRNPVPGSPNANRMNTAIDMNNNPINNISSATLTGTPVVDGAACTTNGTLARDAAGAVMSCVNNIFKSNGRFWQNPVASFSALPVCNAGSSQDVRVVITPSVGTGQRAYTCNGSGAWVALSVDDNGNLTVPGTLSAGAINTATINAATVNAGNANVSGNATVGGAVTASRASISGLITANTMQVDRIVPENGLCNAGLPPGTILNGTMARNSDGVILSCQLGVWRKASGLVGKQLVLDVGNYSGSATATLDSVGGANTRRYVVSGSTLILQNLQNGSQSVVCNFSTASGGCRVGVPQFGVPAMYYKPTLNGLSITTPICTGGFAVGSCVGYSYPVSVVPWAS